MTWQDVIDEAKPKYLNGIKAKITALRKQGTMIIPEDRYLFEPFKLTPYNKVKVVILGKEPNHIKNMSHGLAYSSFSNQRTQTLELIFNEIKRDYLPEFAQSKYNCFQHGNLEQWAKQGVLLLNETFTVEMNNPQSHQEIGWKFFVIDIIKALNKKEKPIVFMFWGNDNYVQYISSKHLILKSEYPTSSSDFNGCNHFTKANTFLQKHYEKGLNWSVLSNYNEMV